MVNRPNDQVLQAHHLSNEIATATELLALGLNQAASPKWVASQPGGVFTQLSQGVERVLKVTFWLSEQSHGREVGSKFGSGSGGHALRELNTQVFGVLSAESLRRDSYVGGLVREINEDPYWPDLLLALDRWATTAGRYRDLDALRGKEADGDPPWVSWENAERRAVTHAGGWADLSAETLVASRTRMLLSIMRWWHTLYRSWQHGVVGQQGERFANALNPANEHLDSNITRLIAGR